MKALNKFFISAGVVAASLTMGSCVNDLDLTPTDPSSVTAAVFDQDPEGYMDKVLADVYLSFCVHGPNNNSQVNGFDGGMSTFQRAIFNLEEVPSDEADWLSPNDAPIYALQFGVVSADNAAVFGAYSRLIINVALCNDFIRTVNDGLFKLPDNLKSKAEENIRQCKILRSACYFYLINFFGDVPYADETAPMGAVAAQLPRAEVFSLVTKTLEDVIAEYGNGGNKAAAYGYVGKDVAQGLLAKFYLNAEVFTGTPAWDKCLAVSKDLINAHKGAGFKNSGLAEHYHQNFAANNKNVTVGGGSGANEVLWILPEDTPNLISYGGATLMLLGWLNKDLATDYNAGNGWICMTARKQFVEKMEWTDRPTCSRTNDDRLSLWKTAADGFSIENGNLDQASYMDNGYAAVKLYNWNMNPDGTWDYDNRPAFDGDKSIQCGWPMLRLSEIYLTAAEAAMKGAASKSEALEYVNLIRERAGLSPWTDAQLTETNLQDERCRELYSECTRRTDLIRYGKWISGYTWNWKGNNRYGTDFAPTFNLYPIPATIIAQSSYKQNPGY
ncbi:MAG: RagB/SusD family nutrient uptake outer membrane protein [Bacteroides sp.]|nr:RagB/SusD family nutrient uptake outer membrane protein [Bacteroides sp.]